VSSSSPKALFPVPGQAGLDVSEDGSFLVHVAQAEAATSIPIAIYS
jgi:hypothetical protein